MVIIATFNEPAKARQLKRRFQDSGIKADVHNEGPVQQFGFMSKPQANAKVLVEDNDFEKAQSLMIKYRIPADDAEIFDARTRRRALRAENYSERILLSGLPLYLDKPGRAYNWTPLASVLPWKRSRTGLKRRAVKALNRLKR